MAKTYSQETKKNSNNMPTGTLPLDKLNRHKLKSNVYSSRIVSGNTKLVKKFVESIKHYRQFVHGVQEARLSAPLKNSAHYFVLPMSRSDSDNAKDRRGVELSVDNSSE